MVGEVRVSSFWPELFVALDNQFHNEQQQNEQAIREETACLHLQEGDRVRR